MDKAAHCLLAVTRIYKLISTKGERIIEGTEEEAIAAAKEMNDDLRPAFGVTVEDESGETVAEIESTEYDVTEARFLAE